MSTIKEVVKEFLTNTKEAVQPKPMRVGDKIRAVLQQHPEIQRRRAQINAIGYLQKKNDNLDIEWHTHHSTTETALCAWRRSSEGHRVDVEILHMPSMSTYLVA